VPVSGTAHINGQATVTFTGGAVLNGASPTWDRTTATCSGVYCHGATLNAGGTRTQLVWNPALATPLDCNSCHRAPPPGHQSWVTATTDCHICHPATVKTDGTIDVAGGKHMNGTIDRLTSDTTGCGTCHPLPPATGAHAAHVKLATPDGVAYGMEWTAEEKEQQLPGSTLGGYSFGCGVCHPKDSSKHGDGFVEVELSAAGGDVGGLRAMNGPAAAFDKATGTCSNVYCHSTGQEARGYVTTPGWYSGAKVGCGSCHGNPPAYANAGPGTASNSHIFLNYQGVEGGHFAGLPGTFHKSRHGDAKAYGSGERAAPMTCQTCHAGSVDPTNVAAGGWFYLDTTITTRLAGGDPSRFITLAWKDTQCTTCHDGGAGSPPQGAGMARPISHVNGRRDVAFDQRTVGELPGWSAYWATTIGLGTFAPTRPYFMTGARFPFPTTLPAGAGFDPAAPTGFNRATLSYELSGATYEPTTRTCSSVACHLGNAVRWGQKDLETATPTCTGCHPMQ
jgi:predicted CxxxxCH...CXXCH cytochrome family protein